MRLGVTMVLMGMSFCALGIATCLFGMVRHIPPPTPLLAWDAMAAIGFIGFGFVSIFRSR